MQTEGRPRLKLLSQDHRKKTENESEGRVEATSSAKCSLHYSTRRGLWVRADTLKGVGGGHVNQVGVRKDKVLTWGQTKQTLTLPRLHVNRTETWQRSDSLPCKVCGEAEEEEGGYGQIDGDTGGGALKELSPSFTKPKDQAVLSNEKSLNRCFQHS